MRKRVELMSLRVGGHNVTEEQQKLADILIESWLKRPEILDELLDRLLNDEIVE